MSAVVAKALARASATLLFCAALGGRPLAAQVPSLGNASPSAGERVAPRIQNLSPAPLHSAVADSGAFRSTYWLEGGLVATGIVAVATLATAHNNCEGSSHCLALNVALFFVGSMVLFPIGALIGGQFHK